MSRIFVWSITVYLVGALAIILGGIVAYELYQSDVVLPILLAWIAVGGVLLLLNLAWSMFWDAEFCAPPAPGPKGGDG